MFSFNQSTNSNEKNYFQVVVIGGTSVGKTALIKKRILKDIMQATIQLP